MNVLNVLEKHRGQTGTSKAQAGMPQTDTLAVICAGVREQV
jgi:hypothetical protein